MRPPWKTALLALPMVLLSGLMLCHGQPPRGLLHAAAFGLVFISFNAMFVLMLHTGKTDRWRAPIFISYAALFTVSFVSRLIASRGSMSLSSETMLKGGTPFCHIVIPMTLIPALLKRTIIFPGSIIGSFASVAPMLVIWLGASLALGKGWCSWGCFFGGWDDGFSRLLKRPIVRDLSQKWADLPFAVLMIAALTSAASLSPTYCTWACPFKAVTEFKAVTSTTVMIQTAIFVTLFLVFVVVLPLLLKRRAQCAMLCPFGAFQSGANWVNPFEVRIDASTCVRCRLCIQRCPTLSLTDETVAQGRSSATCMKCGKCVDACPKGAARFHVKGTSSAASPETARLLFLYPAFLFLAAMAGGSCQDGLCKLLRLAAAGRMF